ncbi:glycosyl hydrolase family 43 [Ilyomonas limi]|uniref:Glycosyl hydrolase family 43 n=1 Tax=Ilyomonas limi TaxID=2575867 RepID=A0A4U3L192_9BACT|nr:glycoside hydrolase family 43 protein [Ilyomonas limi]TKK68532.1 glycosyl hydrolase family 43 [Ilyomonas limi]
MKPFYFLFILIITCTQFSCSVQKSNPPATTTFTNPLLPSGADPYSFYKDGYYYYTNSLGDKIGLWKTKNLADLPHAQYKTIYTPPSGTMYSKDLWAPEVMFLKGKWYAYFAADDGDNNHHRMYVLENASADPMEGDWTFKGEVNDSANKWAIDGDVYEYNDQLYMVWSGWQSDVNGEQDIYIAKMSNPWTISSGRVRISRPTYDWETHGDLNDPVNPPHVSVNEGPQFLAHNNKLFVIYSASGCWTDYYALGMLTFNGQGDLLDSTAWTKNPEPVFKQSPQNSVYAPGHNSFFKSPGGTQDWILYHANDAPGLGCSDKRSPRMQPFTWNADGTPNFGVPVKEGVPIPIPQ